MAGQTQIAPRRIGGVGPGADQRNGMGRHLPFRRVGMGGGRRRISAGQGAGDGEAGRIDESGIIKRLILQVCQALVALIPPPAPAA